MESHDSHPQIDRDELVAFIVDKSQRLSADKDFIVAMDRLIQFAKHMREREREAQVAHALRFMCCACLVTFSRRISHLCLLTPMASSAANTCTGSSRLKAPESAPALAIPVNAHDVAAAYFSARLTLEARYDDDAKLKQLMRTLDTNGDGVVRAAPCTMLGLLPHAHSSFRWIGTSWSCSFCARRMTQATRISPRASVT
jgi:hypothetical protein